MSAPEEIQAQASMTEMSEITETPALNDAPAGSRAETARADDSNAKNGESSKPKPQAIPLHESLLQRVSTIKEGDNVLLRMPSDMVKAVVASKDG
jgi:tRNA (adenine-N(1)-)-methyltransferase non-catalytic subunit